MNLTVGDRSPLLTRRPVGLWPYFWRSRLRPAIFMFPPFLEIGSWNPPT